MDVDRLVGTAVGLSPHFRQQLGAADHGPGVLGEVAEKVELAARPG